MIPISEGVGVWEEGRDVTSGAPLQLKGSAGIIARPVWFENRESEASHFIFCASALLLCGVKIQEA